MQKKSYTAYVLGFLAGAVLTAFATGELVLNAQDAVTRVKEQYRDCRVVGDYPTSADMARGGSHQ